MPFATFKSVYSVSSEDQVYCASNLLKSDPVKKWKTCSNGEKSANVVLQFEQPEFITGVDIGNEHSAFIEVLVGRNGWSSDKFKELVLTSSFMTPIESKNSINLNRIRCFNQSDESWIKNESNDKWDLIKFICTQPFNKHVQYGLSLIKVHVASNETKELVPKKFIQQQRKIINENKTNDIEDNSSNFLGKFKLRNDSDNDDDESSTTLFNRWKKQSTTPDIEKKQNTAASIRDASRCSDEATLPKKLKFTKHSNSTNNTTDIVKILDRNRNDLLFNKEDETSDEVLEKKIAIDKKHLEKELIKDKVQKHKKEEIKTTNSNKENNKNITKCTLNKPDNTFSSKMKDLFDNDSSDNDEFNASTSTKDVSKINVNERKRPSSDSVDTSNTKRKRRVDIYKPFNKLLENVVLVISGIQNPQRADIRSKALLLGAKYKPDWDSTCTHLVCAFKNTPKYNQVQSMNGKIIKKSWVEKCYNLKKRLPWRRYALDSDEEAKSESEDEILDISMKPSTSTSEFLNEKKTFAELLMTSPADKKTENYKNEMKSTNTLNSDIENKVENLQRVDDKVLQKNEKNNSFVQKITKDNDNKIIKNETKDIYDATTDEDEFTKINKIKQLKSEKNFFKNINFHLDSKLNVIEKNKLINMIEDFGGIVCHQHNKDTNYIISNNYENYKNLNSFKGEIVKPLWIYECYDMECLIPTKRYLT